MPTTIEIDVQARWDAVALMQRLDPYHPYLIQFAPERWLVHARCPGCHGERLPNALAAIEESLASRHLERVQVRVDGRPYVPGTGGEGEHDASRGGVRRSEIRGAAPLEPKRVSPRDLADTPFGRRRPVTTRTRPAGERRARASLPTAASAPLKRRTQ